MSNLQLHLVPDQTQNRDPETRHRLKKNISRVQILLIDLIQNI